MQTTSFTHIPSKQLLPFCFCICLYWTLNPYHTRISRIETKDSFKLETGDGFKIGFVLNGGRLGANNVMDMRKDLGK